MRSVKLLDNYELFEDGTLISYCRCTEGRRLKPNKNKNGYLTFEIKGKVYKLHRLLAIHFIPNLDNKPYVNHIDGNKQNNRLDNLEWVTPSENTKHAYDNKLCPRQKGKRIDNKTVYQYTKEGKFVAKYDSVTEAAMSINPTKLKTACSAIVTMCSGYKKNGVYSMKSYKGFIWSYVER